MHRSTKRPHIARAASGLMLALALPSSGCKTSSPTVPAGWEPTHFLTGCWRADGDDGTSLEVWTAPHGDTMYGQNHSLRRGQLSFFELLTIERREENMVYVARPRGGASTEFVMTSHERGMVTFENPEHDFPKRIHYELMPSGELTATVDGGAGATDGKKLEFRWRPVR